MILCMNAVTGGVTEWDLDWLGVGVHNDIVYGVTADALVSLDGDSEVGFTGEIRTGQLELGDMYDFTVSRAYFAIENTEDVILTITSHKHGNSNSLNYTISVRAHDGTDTETYRDEPLARGVFTPLIDFKLSGSSWSLENLQVLSHIVRRKI